MEKKDKKTPSPLSYLNPKFHKHCRRDCVETDYINGVYDQKGNQVIRPLTQEEKLWLANNYYKTEIAQSYTPDERAKIPKKQRKRLDLDNNARKRCIADNKNCFVKVKKKKAENKEFIEIDEFIVDRYDAHLMRQTPHIDHELILINQVEQSIKNKRLTLIKTKTKKKGNK
jgi:ribosomal protein L21